MRPLSTVTTIFLLGLLYPLTVFSQDETANAWPKEITIPQGKVIIYQPQPDKLDGSTLYGRAAVAEDHRSLVRPASCS